MTETILEEAQRIVHADREAVYAHPSEDYARVARLWSAFLGVEIRPDQAAICMALVKVARLAHTPAHRDSLVDLAGYAEVAARIQGIDP